MDYPKFSHKTAHLKGKKHQLDPNLDLKQLVHHATVQYVDRDADGDVDVYDNPKKGISDENPVKDFGTMSKKLIAKQKGEVKHTKRGVAFESISNDDSIDEGLVGKLIDKVKGRKAIGKTGSGGNVYVSTRNKPSKVSYQSSSKPKQPEKKTSEIDHDDPWLKHSSGAEKKAHYRQLRGESTEPKDHEYSMARSELSTIISAAKRLQKKIKSGEGNLEAWVQSKITKAADYIDAAADHLSSGESDLGDLDEAVRIPTKNGNLLMVILTWKGSTYALRVFFPQSKIPNRREVEEQIQKIYPGCKVVQFRVVDREPGEPFLQIEDWQKVNKSDETDGMSQKAVNAYRKENPGSKLKTAVTEKDPGPGRSKRRKSFCARSEGQKDMHNIDCTKDPDKAICKARKRWRC
jgi:hypothetical protein